MALGLGLRLGLGFGPGLGLDSHSLVVLRWHHHAAEEGGDEADGVRERAVQG